MRKFILLYATLEFFLTAIALPGHKNPDVAALFWGPLVGLPLVLLAYVLPRIAAALLVASAVSALAVAYLGARELLLPLVIIAFIPHLLFAWYFYKQGKRKSAEQASAQKAGN